ncbi:MAG: TetR/AcrR family transcriptional regulator [Chloroflexota bacterium]
MTTRPDRSTAQERTRLDLIRAANNILMRDGYTSLTVTAIAAESGYGRRTFYRYFKNRDALVYHMVVTWITALAEQAITRAQHLPTPQREYAVLQHILSGFYSNRDLFRSLSTFFQSPHGKRVTETMRQHFLSALQAGRLNFNNRVSNEVVSHVHAGGFSHLIRQVIWSSEMVDVDEVVREYFILTFGEEPPEFTD